MHECLHVLILIELDRTWQFELLELYALFSGGVLAPSAGDFDYIQRTTIAARKWMLEHVYELRGGHKAVYHCMLWESSVADFFLGVFFFVYHVLVGGLKSQRLSEEPWQTPEI